MMKEAAETWALVSQGTWYCHLPATLLQEEESEEVQSEDLDEPWALEGGQAGGTEHEGWSVVLETSVPVANGIFLQLIVPKRSPTLIFWSQTLMLPKAFLL